MPIGAILETWSSLTTASASKPYTMTEPRGLRRVFSTAGHLDGIAACCRSLGGNPRGVLSDRRMGPFGPVSQPKTDCRVLRAASPVRIAAVGIGQISAGTT